MNNRKVKSAKGELVDFEMLKVMGNTQPQEIRVADNTRYIDAKLDKRLAARSKMIPEELLAANDNAADTKDTKDVKDTKEEPKPTTTKRPIKKAVKPTEGDVGDE